VALRKNVFYKTPSPRPRRLAAFGEVNPRDFNKIKRLLAER
jgi:hypothetical protein